MSTTGRRLLLVVLALWGTASAKYLPTGQCEDTEVCTYRYETKQVLFDGPETEVTTLSTDLEVTCMSTGTFNDLPSTRYCMELRNVEISTNLPTTEEQAPEEESSNDTVHHVHEVPGMSFRFVNNFCFVQADDGRVVGVIYPKSERMEIANAKKGIVSAFQANFKKELTRMEGDAAGRYLARYKFSPDSPDGLTHYTRNISSSDIQYLPNVPKDIKFKYRKEDEYVYRGRKLVRVTGEMVFSMGDKTEDQEPFSGETTGDFDKEFSGKGYYNLTRLYCSPQSGRERRSVAIDVEEASHGGLLYEIDEADEDQKRMNRLRRSVPHIPNALGDLHKNPNEHKIANILQQLMYLETKYGPPSGRTSVTAQVITYLRRIFHSKEENDVEMRKLLYSLLAPSGDVDVQKVLLEAFERLHREGEGDEKESLLTYLAFLKDATVETVDKLFSMVTDDRDPLLLVLGSLAEFTSEPVQEEIVTELASRLTTVSNSTDNEGKIVLLHSLGNTGSPQAMKVLLEYVDDSDLEVQKVAISGLRMFTTVQVVQDALTDLLKGDVSEEIVETIAQTLISGLRDHAQHADAEGDPTHLNLALVREALKSENANLHNLVFQYLKEVGTEDADKLMSVLMEEAVSDPIYDYDNYNSSETRRRRDSTSNWDTYSSIYNIIASQSSRASDVRTFPTHRSFLWAEKPGVSKVYAHYGAGAFAGVASNCRYKVFAKAIAQGHAFGKTATAAHVEFSRTKTGSSPSQRIYVKVVGRVLKNEYSSSSICARKSTNLYQSRITVFCFSIRIFILVGFLRISICLYVTFRVDLKLCACERTCSACATVVGGATLIPEADASASLAELVRGGLTVSGSITYQLEPEVCADVNRWNIRGALYFSRPYSYVDLYAYYQWRSKVKLWPPWKFRWTWGSKKKWDRLSARWTIGSSSRRLLYGSGTASCNT